MLELLILLQNRVYMAVPRPNPLFEKKVLDLDDLRKSIFLGYTSSNKQQEHLNQLLQEKGVQLNCADAQIHNFINRRTFAKFNYLLMVNHSP